VLPLIDLLDKVSGQFRIVHDEEVCDLYRSLIIVRVVKYRGLRWAGHVTGMEETDAQRKTFKKQM
jgi:hypothetical protein